MIWFYFVLISMLLLCPNTTILATCSSIGNQSAAATDGNYGGINKSCFHKEKQALLHFKASLRDPLGQLSTWRPAEDDDCCKWSGVTCNNHTGHVTELNLHSYHLRGEISPSLLNLTYLNHLDLCFNSFDGTIPKVITSMTQLRYLDLSFNFFHGTIPRSIGSLTQLRYLDLSFNFFNGTILPEFGNLTNLRNLSLGNNERLSTIQTLDWLSNLSHLQHLDMTHISLANATH
ncbi:Leucine-rich repeat-containing protein [Cynara cardunculus var. scolymus]|uniref:Leucine-rich repeat-containing protein n=1 Tax=Cynara cardunculus var. scolymus TaxID=59895 RepID=A0A103XHD4_CYNCS|nr:Leucine-rich repeat-containing protein [Cynara cardunculus var. scolymus]